MIGIYKITSPKGKSYIGQSVDIERRMVFHKNHKGNTHLARSIKKYGFEAHTIEILCECSKEELNTKEIYYIDLYKTFDSKTGLNLKGGGQSGGCCSEETKAKLRKPKSEQARENYRIAALNRPPVSKETREKHRKNMTGNKNLLGKKVWLGRKHSEETKKVISEKIKALKLIGEKNPNYKNGKYRVVKP